MSRSAARWVVAANLAVAASGLGLGLALYAYTPPDDFAGPVHPWTPELLHAHVLAAPVFLFACAWIFPSHVWPRVRSAYPRLRATGLTLFAAFAPMVASGYLLQVSETEAARTLWIWVHWIASLLWLPAFVAHQVGALRLRRRPPAEPLEPTPDP